MTDPPAPLRPRVGRLTLVFLAVVVAGSAAAALLRSEGASDVLPAGPLAGQPAPDFQAPLFDGSTFQLSEHLASDGRPLVLNLWASWCGPCRAEMPELSAFAVSHPEVRLVGIAVNDTEADAMAFVEELQPTFATGIDRDGSVRRLYPTFGLPSTLVIDTEGNVVHHVDGPVTSELLERMVP